MGSGEPPAASSFLTLSSSSSWPRPGTAPGCFATATDQNATTHGRGNHHLFLLFPCDFRHHAGPAEDRRTGFATVAERWPVLEAKQRTEQRSPPRPSSWSRR